MIKHKINFKKKKNNKNILDFQENNINNKLN